MNSKANIGVGRLGSVCVAITLLAACPRCWAEEPPVYDLIDIAQSSRMRHPKPVTTVLFLRSGEVLITACADGVVRFCNIKKNEIEAEIQAASKGRTCSICLTKDSKTLFAAGDPIIKVLDTQKRDMLWTMEFSKEQSPVMDIAVSPDSKSLAVLFEHSSVLLEARTGKTLFRFDSKESRLRDCVFSNDSKRLMVTSKIATSILDVKAFRIDRSFSCRGTEYPLGIAWSPDDSVIAIGSSNGQVDLWDAQSGEKKHTFIVEGSVPLFVRYMNKDNLLTADDLGNLKAWSVSQKKLLGRQKCASGEITGLQISPDGKRIGVASIDGDVAVYDLIQR